MKKFIFTILVFVSLFVAGCGQQNTQSSTASYMSGTRGIEMEFVPRNPPSVIYLDRTYSEDTPVEVEAFNHGTSPSDNIESFFSGFDRNIVDVPDLSGMDFSSQDTYRTRYNPEGGYDAAKSQISVGNMGNADTYEFDLKLIYCYEYRTRVAVGLCVDPNPNRMNKDDSCIPSSVSTSGQGAPIGISNVEVTSIPGNVRLKMTVNHYGQGEVLAGNTPCDGITYKEDEGYVDFTMPTLGGVSGDCVTQTPVKLRDGRASIICNFPLDKNDNAYETILETELYNYKIKDSIQKHIKIINEEDTLR